MTKKETETEKPTATPKTEKPETAEQKIRRAIKEHEEHHQAFMADARRHDVDADYMDSMFAIVSARVEARDVSGVTASRLDALAELIGAYHEQAVRMRRGRRGELNRFWQAWAAVLAVW